VDLTATFQRVIGDEYAGKLAVAVHIRRGDACNRWAEPGDGDYADKRPCFQRGELDRALTYASIVADLEVLGSCDAIVGTAASWVSRLIFLLIVGNTGRTPPHVFLDQRFGGPADVW